MTQVSQSGIWTLFIPNLTEGDLYKFEIHDRKHHRFLKADPFAFYSEVRPQTASIVWNVNKYEWNDQAWMNQRKKQEVYHNPMLIYEVHLGSWKKKEDGCFLTYKELAYELVDYVIENGYTHIELMPIMEHPYDRSWGYQLTGYFSVTSRYGTPEDFMFFMDRCHQNGIGVILDWVPVHFCKDAHGLARFDGTPIYESTDPERAERANWGTYNFDFSRPEVRSFLISNLMFWLDTYHVDGFRIDAVSHMIHLNHDRTSNLRLKNINNGEEDLDALVFVRTMNEAVFEAHPDVLMIAEEATDYPLVTGRTDQNGLGFNYKWNMGWVHDVLRYMAYDQSERPRHHDLLTFSLLYTYSENFILPFSHDELVYGKKSLLNKMSGSYEEKFANLRVLLGFYMTHPGKKLLFMGSEFGQFDEWKDLTELDWNLLNQFDSHRKFKTYSTQLNQFYKSHRCFWRLDHEPDGFHWIDPNARDERVITFIRKGRHRGDQAIVVCNFSSEFYESFDIGVPSKGIYLEVFNSDQIEYGGKTDTPSQRLETIDAPYQGMARRITATLPPLSMLVFMKETKKWLRSDKL